MRPSLANLITGGLLWSALSFYAAAQNPLSVAPPEKDNSVAAELASFELAPGYEANLFADETDGIVGHTILDPVSGRRTHSRRV